LEMFGLRIEFQRTTQTIGDVAELAVNTRNMGVERGHWQVLRLARAHGFEETLKLTPLFDLRGVCRDGDGFAVAGLAFFVSEEALFHHVITLGSEEAVAAISAISFLE